jgi:hypothetical protein
MPNLEYAPEAAYTALVFLLIPLLGTVVIEVSVAAFFRLGWKALLAVGLASGVTNPLMNLLLLTLYGLGLGFRKTGSYEGDPVYEPTAMWYLALVAAELIVIIVEWRLLVWALRDRFEPRRLLLVVVLANAVSASLGVFLILRAWSS